MSPRGRKRQFQPEPHQINPTGIVGCLNPTHCGLPGLASPGSLCRVSGHSWPAGSPVQFEQRVPLISSTERLVLTQKRIYSILSYRMCRFWAQGFVFTVSAGIRMASSALTQAHFGSANAGPGAYHFSQQSVNYIEEKANDFKDF